MIRKREREIKRGEYSLKRHKTRYFQLAEYDDAEKLRIIIFSQLFPSREAGQ